ncbi:MAG: penicillin-binding protein [Clostridia bacterium]|nr:penicillin-binding protein [Clostridia bacterium]
MAPEKKTKRKLNVFRAILLSVLVLSIIAVGAGAGYTIDAIRSMPDWQPENLELAMTTFIYDKDNNLVEELHGEQNRIIVPLEKIPEDLKNAVIATEDARFYQHHGIDLKAIARAIFINLTSGHIREGGSTITQQLAKNAFIEKPEKTIKRKIQEAFMAIQLERTYTKDEILEKYLNIVYLGPGTYGVEAASQYYFGKSVEELNLAESSILAGLIQAPALYSPLNKDNEEATKARQAHVLDNMVKYGYITQEEAEQAKKQKLTYEKANNTQEAAKYPYFVDAVIEEASRLLENKGIESSQLFTGGLKIYTTLDPKVQSKMEEVYSDSKNFPASSTSDRLIQSAMVVLDPSSGEVRGLIGGRDYITRRGYNRAIQATRQPGSIIKPLVVYGPAVEKGYPPAHVIYDIPTSFGKYTPHNYDGRYRGMISMREALRWSVNVPAVRMLKTIGVETAYQYGTKLGLPLRPEDKNLTLALGTTSVSPLQIAGAYGAFANRGVYIKPHLVTKITDRKGHVLVKVVPQKTPVWSEQTAYLVTDMLQTVVRSGTGTRARMNRPVAGKTGTTSLPEKYSYLHGEMDAWFVGYTPELVGVVWMGYDEFDPEHYLKSVFGGGHPASIWKKVISAALEGVPVKDFPRPSGIVYADIDAKSGQYPSDLTPEKFIVKEIFTQNMLPHKVSDAWVKTQICTETAKLATPYCPEVVTKVFLKTPEGYSDKAEDFYLMAPKEICPVHGGGIKTGETPIVDKTPDNENENSQPTMEQNNSEQQKLIAPNLNARLEVDPNVTKPRVILNWDSQNNNDEILYSIERHSKKGGRKNIAIVKETTYTDANVRPGTTYHYRVIALNEQDDVSKQSNEVTITIPKR